MFQQVSVKKGMVLIDYQIVLYLKLVTDSSSVVLYSEHWCTSWGYQFKVPLLRGLKEPRYETFNKLRISKLLV